MPEKDAGHEEDSLRPLVESLEREVAGLQESARLRGVIEQAKGVLVERYGISASEAFDRLRQMSQRENARLVDVAATVLGVAQPADDGAAVAVEEDSLPRQMQATAATSQEWQKVRAEPTTRAAAVGVVVESLAAATADGDAAARMILDLAGSSEPEGVLIYAARDGALEVLGAAGYPAEVTGTWSRVPLVLDIPITRCWKRRQHEVVSSRSEILDRYPSLSEGALDAYQSWLFAPVVDGSTAVGVVVMGWSSPRHLEEGEAQRLVALVDRAGPVVLGTLTGREPARDQLAALLRLNPDPWMVLVPADESTRAPETVLIEAVAPEVPDSASWEGRRLLAAIPGLATQHTLLTDLTRLLQDDTLYVLAIDLPGATGAPWDARVGRLRAVRAGRRIVLTWRDTAV